MNQWEFDADLRIRYDDTGLRMPIPEESDGYRDNPIRKLFEQDKEVDVEDSGE